MIIRDVSERKDFEDALKRHNLYLESLQAISLRLMNRLDLDTLLGEILDRSSELLDTQHAYFYLVNDEKDRLELVMARGYYQSLVGKRIQKGENPSGQIWENGQLLVTEEYCSLPGRVADRTHVHAWMGIPLKQGKEVLGVFGLARLGEDRRPFSDQEISIMEQLASMASISVINVKADHELFRELERRKQAESELVAMNDELEERVTARTLDLSEANEELAAQYEEISAMNEELGAQNEEIRAMNDENEDLNQQLLGLNEKLEARVAERTADLIAVHLKLTAQNEALRQAQEELRDTGDHLRKLIQYSSAPIIVWNPEFIITRFNKAFEQLTGYQGGEVIGRPLSVIFPRESLQETVGLIEQSRSGVHWEAVEIPIRRKSGEVRITLWNAANIYAADAVTLTAVIAQGQDITERVRREQEAMRDAQLAMRVQKALLPVTVPSEYIEVATIYNPFGYVGGDLYFLDWRYGGKLLRGFLVDATGHGLGTALHTASLHVLLREVNERDLPLTEAMRWLNRRAGEYFAEGIFAGALGFELDLETRQLRWVCAGIPEVWMTAKAMAGAVQCPGMCLGIMEEETFEMHRLPIEVGDCFYFMTDGLSDFLGEQLNQPLALFPEMVSLLRDLSEAETRRDDATAVCIQVRALPQPLTGQYGWPRIIRFSGYGDYQRLGGEVAKIIAEVTGLPHSFHEVAVNEALANAMECRDGVPRQHKARLRFNKVGNRLIVRVRTSRLAFAGNAVLRRLRAHPEDMFSFGEDASMGRGIPLMLSLSHKMTYNSEGTEVLLAWKL